MSGRNDYEIRYKAIQLHQGGISFNNVFRRVRRSCFWFTKWLQRYREHGLAGLRDQTRAPKRIHNRTPEPLVRKILALRDAPAAHKGRRAAFAGIGAETIHMGDLQQTDLVGPRYLRGSRGVTRFYSIHTIDVAGQTTSASQFPDKQTISLCRHLVDSWCFMGLPRVSQMDNEMSAMGGGRYRYSLSQVIRLHLLLGIHFLFIPPGEPGRNAAVESFNGLWQKRVLFHSCPDLRALRRTSDGKVLDIYK